MLKIYVDLWRYGNQNDQHRLVELDIWNDGTGGRDIGNYGFRLKSAADGRPLGSLKCVTGALTGVPRRDDQQHVLGLVREVLSRIVPRPKRIGKSRTAPGRTIPEDVRATPDWVAAQWNRMCEAHPGHGFRRCILLTPERAEQTTKIVQRYTKAEIGMAMIAVTRSPFCQGRNERKWRAGYDWFIRPLTIAKLLEGTFDADKKPDRTAVSIPPRGTRDEPTDNQKARAHVLVQYATKQLSKQEAREQLVALGAPESELP